VVIFGIPNGLSLLAARQTHDGFLLPIMFFFSLSVFCFFSYRWHILRTDLSRGRLSADEFRRDPRRHLRGPAGIYYTWMSGTLLIMFAILFYELLTERSPHVP
jgi:hypothetical protein